MKSIRVVRKLNSQKTVKNKKKNPVDLTYIINKSRLNESKMDRSSLLFIVFNKSSVNNIIVICE